MACSIFHDEHVNTHPDVERKYWTPDNMIRMILLGQEFQIHKNTLRDSDSKTLRRLRPQPSCPYYMPDMSEVAGQQTYYLCQRPRAFESVIMYMEGGLLSPPSNMSIDEFIDELLFYEIRKLDSAIQAYTERFDDSDSDSDTEDEFEETFPGEKEHWLRKCQRITHIVMDGTVDDDYDAHDGARESALMSKEEDEHKNTYRNAQGVYTLVSMSIVLISIIIFIMDTMPWYRLGTQWDCTISNATTDACHLGSAAFKWDADVLAKHATAPLVDGIGDNGYIHEDLKASPHVTSISGIITMDGVTFAADDPSTGNDNCDCIADEVIRVSATLEKIDLVCFVFFVVEVVVRFLSWRSKKHWFWNIMVWIDILALVPNIIKYAVESEDGTSTTYESTNRSNALYALRVLRMVRMFRLFRLSRYFAGITIFAKAISDSRQALFQLFICIIVVSVMFATIMFYIEHTLEDVGFGRFHSIPYGMWWSIVTMSTLGYGDMVPQHWLGKTFGAICAMCGILVIALPVPVFVENFQRLWDEHYLTEHVKSRRKEKERLQALGANGIGFKAAAAAQVKRFKSESGPDSERRTRDGILKVGGRKPSKSAQIIPDTADANYFGESPAADKVSSKRTSALNIFSRLGGVVPERQPRQNIVQLASEVAAEEGNVNGGQDAAGTAQQTADFLDEAAKFVADADAASSTTITGPGNESTADLHA